MKRFLDVVHAFAHEDDGATMIEYALLVALIAIVVAAALVTLGTALKTKYSSVSDCIATPATACT
jgi:pilus assembly protein Flp/PilA